MAPHTSSRVLAYAVRGGVVAKYLGQLALVVALLTLPPSGVALLYGELGLAMRFAAVVVTLVLVGLPLARLREPRRLQTNEALTVTALAFVLTALAMTWPMTGAGLGWLDALFESVSAVTTTGLSTSGSVADRPQGFIFLRAWMQWYGGLGIAVLTLVLVTGHHAAARRLVEAEAPEGLVTTTRAYGRRVLTVYTVLTIAALAMLVVVGAGGFDTLVHLLAAVSTGGFSSFDDSLGGFDGWAIPSVVMGLAFLGAVSIPAYYRAYDRGWRELATDPELRGLAALCLVMVGALAWARWAQAGQAWPRALLDALTLGVSAQTTTGFSTHPPQALDPVSKAVTIAAMTIGGSVGSSAGGMKILHFLVVLRVIQLTLRRTAMPAHAVSEPRVGGRRVAEGDLMRALTLALLFALVSFVSWLVFLAFGHDPLDALFEVVSATGTVGLSTGVTAPDLHPVLKTVLCIDMLLGRLEVVALLVVLYPRTWIGARAEAA